eukprot:Opistho-2@79593
MNKAKLFFQFSKSLEGNTGNAPHQTPSATSTTSHPPTPLFARSVQSSPHSPHSHTPHTAHTPHTHHSPHTPHTTPHPQPRATNGPSTPSGIASTASRILSPATRSHSDLSSPFAPDTPVPITPNSHAGSKDASSELIVRFLRIVGLAQDDLAILRFWTSGLSKQHRTRLLLDTQHSLQGGSHLGRPGTSPPPSSTIGPKSRSPSIPVGTRTNSVPGGAGGGGGAAAVAVVVGTAGSTTSSSSPVANSHSSNSGPQSFVAGMPSSLLMGGTPGASSVGLVRAGQSGSIGSASGLPYAGYTMAGSLSKANGLRY